MLSLDDPTEELALNLTNTPDVNEDYPAWSSPGGQTIAYSALADGLEVVYAKRIDAINEPPVVIDRGRMPTWSPDGSSLVRYSRIYRLLWQRFRADRHR